MQKKTVFAKLRALNGHHCTYLHLDRFFLAKQQLLCCIYMFSKRHTDSLKINTASHHAQPRSRFQTIDEEDEDKS